MVMVVIVFDDDQVLFGDHQVLAVDLAEDVRVQLPAAAPIPSVWSRGRKVMHLPCKQVDEGAIPSDSTISLRGE